MKANPKYQLKRLSDAVMHAFEQNSKLSPESQIPISMSTVQRKTKEIKETFLEQHSQSPFMDDTELEAVKAFKASNTWAARIMKRIKSEAPQTLDQLHQLVGQYQPEQGRIDSTEQVRTIVDEDVLTKTIFPFQCFAWIRRCCLSKFCRAVMLAAAGTKRSFQTYSKCSQMIASQCMFAPMKTDLKSCH
mmetsp:Transcript_21479/g.46554  ORF Transcript_21479/g.46554 Transcript_21479/m.46554 type:complete len:189 (-) Transcript_21479:1292-1858(-)